MHSADMLLPSANKHYCTSSHFLSRVQFFDSTQIKTVQESGGAGVQRLIPPSRGQQSEEVVGCNESFIMFLALCKHLVL